MLKPPMGVLELVGNPPHLQTVLPGAWTFFCFKSDAENLLNAMNQKFGFGLQLVDDTIAGNAYIYLNDNTPRIWSIVGQDSAGNQIYEFAASILDRRVKPYIGVDKGSPYKPDDNLEMNFSDSYGIAQFNWIK